MHSPHGICLLHFTFRREQRTHESGALCDERTESAITKTKVIRTDLLHKGGLVISSSLIEAL